MKKVVVKISKVSVVTLTNHVRWANYTSPGCKFPIVYCICAKNYENWLAVDTVIAKISRLTFFGPPCMCDWVYMAIHYVQKHSTYRNLVKYGQI